MLSTQTWINSNRMADAVSEGNDRSPWKEVHRLNKSCNFLPNVMSFTKVQKILLTYFPQSLNNYTILLDSVRFDED